MPKRAARTRNATCCLGAHTIRRWGGAVAQNRIAVAVLLVAIGRGGGERAAARARTILRSRCRARRRTRFRARSISAASCSAQAPTATAGAGTVDYPRADVNLSIRLSELTKTRITTDAQGEPEHVVIALTDPALFECPFIMMTEARRRVHQPAGSSETAGVPGEGGIPLGGRLLGLLRVGALGAGARKSTAAERLQDLRAAEGPSDLPAAVPDRLPSSRSRRSISGPAPAARPSGVPTAPFRTRWASPTNKAA